MENPKIIDIFIGHKSYHMAKKRYSYNYPHPAVTTDNVIFGYEHREGLSVLLIRRGIEPYKGQWAFPGGFLRMDESAEEGARRELREETGLEHAPMEQFGCFSAVNRDPRERVITIAFFSLVKVSEVRGGDDAERAQWFPLSNLPPLAFDHEEILDVAVRKLRERLHFSPVGFELLPEIFTMPDLQRIYETILGVEFDRRNFASKMLKLGILEEVGSRPEGAGPRIPSRYRFNKEKYDDIKRSGVVLEFQGTLKKKVGRNDSHV